LANLTNISQITYNFAAAQQPEGLFPEAIEQNIVVM